MALNILTSNIQTECTLFYHTFLGNCDDIFQQLDSICTSIYIWQHYSFV